MPLTWGPPAPPPTTLTTPHHCRSRPIVYAIASLSIYPTMFNPEERTCTLEGTDTHVAW